jgi:ureidoglycolate dehydrogenase (NAD+)
MATQIPAAELQTFAGKALSTAGIPEDDAAVAARVIVAANRKGIDSHGVVRLAHYVRRIKNGTIKTEPSITVDRRAPAVAIVDGDDGLGQVVMSRATDEAISMAKEVGLATVVVKNSSHFGIAGHYAEVATRAGCASLVTTSSDSFLIPFGAALPFFGTNPIAFGFPTGSAPMILDMATTTVPYGKVSLAKAEGQKIPESWGFNADGHPTTDPDQIVGLHPVAGPKGSGLAAVIDVLSNLFVGANWGPHIVKMYGDMEKPRKLGHFITVWNVAAFRDMGEFIRDIDTMIGELHALPTAEGFSNVYYPGELEAERAKKREQNGVPVEDGLLAELNDLADQLNLNSLA